MSSLLRMQLIAFDDLQAYSKATSASSGVKKNGSHRKNRTTKYWPFFVIHRPIFIKYLSYA